MDEIRKVLWRAIDCLIRPQIPAGQALSRFALRDLRQERLHRRQHAGDDDVDTLRQRVDAVGLVELHVAGDAVEKERIERHAILLRQRRIDGVEALLVGRPHVRRRQHSGEQHRDAACLQPRQRVVERLLGDRRIEPAQRVIGAELEDHALRAVGDRPVEAGEPGGRGVAGNPCILNQNIVSAGLERGFQFRRKGLVCRQSEPRGEAVAKGDEAYRLGARRSRAPNQCESQQHTQRQEGVPVPLSRRVRCTIWCGPECGAAKQGEPSESHAGELLQQL